MPHDDATIARAKSFESGAESYDQLRPGYPDQLFDDVFAYASKQGEIRVLDVGAGTGKATIPLALRGLRVTAVEPAESMAQLLRSSAERAGVGDRVTVRVAAFEDLSAADGPFDLVVAAQSFHWTDPTTRWSRLLDLLPPAGVAALFWNNWHLDPEGHDLGGVRRTYERLAPDLVADLPARALDPWPDNEIRATAGLVDVRERAYDWGWVLPTPNYVKLLSTTSQYAVTPEPLRAALFSGLASLLGERVHLRGATRLHLMRKTSVTEA